jgi:hypothetical protein
MSNACLAGETRRPIEHVERFFGMTRHNYRDEGT